MDRQHMRGASAPLRQLKEALRPMAAATRHRNGASRAPEVTLDIGQSVRYLRRHVGLTEVDLADGTGASTRTVRRWTAPRPTHPQTRYVRHIDDLKAIAQELEDSLTPKGTRQWLRARNRNLNGARPIDALRAGDFDRVKQAAQALSEGYFV